MYKLSDYIYRGKTLVNNRVFPSNKKLSTLMLYTTDRCNSKCKHCLIWEKKPKKHLSFEKIKELLNSKIVSKKTLVGLEGGEFLLHPEAMQIMEYMSKHHPKFDLLSNCIQPQKVIEAVKKYTPLRLFISLDGDKKTHNEKIRRTPQGYEKVIQTIEALSKDIPISVMFTLTPFNSLEDMKHVASVCSKLNVDMRIGIYSNMDYFDTQLDANVKGSLDYSINEIPYEVKQFAENYDFLTLYTEYREGNLKLSCNSIIDSLVIYPNGDVPVCQNKFLLLGNVFKDSLDTIFNRKKTIDIHKKLRHNCNECFVNFHRKYDIVLHRNAEKIMPKRIAERLLGKYKWSANESITYKKYLASKT